MCNWPRWRTKSLQPYSFGGKVTIRSDMRTEKKKSWCPTVLPSTIRLSLNLPSIRQVLEITSSMSLLQRKGKCSCGVVSTDSDAVRRTGSVSNEPETTSKRARCRRTTTKEASHLNATDFVTTERRTGSTSLFENLSSTKGKRQKRHSSSLLPGAGPKRKRGRCAHR